MGAYEIVRLPQKQFSPLSYEAIFSVKTDRFIFSEKVVVYNTGKCFFRAARNTVGYHAKMLHMWLVVY